VLIALLAAAVVPVWHWTFIHNLTDTYNIEPLQQCGGFVFRHTWSESLLSDKNNEGVITKYNFFRTGQHLFGQINGIEPNASNQSFVGQQW
jgi:hypothetical protein